LSTAPPAAAAAAVSDAAWAAASARVRGELGALLAAHRTLGVRVGKLGAAVRCVGATSAQLHQLLTELEGRPRAAGG